MQIQHIDATITTSENPQQGEIQVQMNELSDLQLPIIGTSGVWDTWLTPLSYLAEPGTIQHLEVLPVQDDSTHINLKIKLDGPNVSVKIRVYVLSQ